MSCSGLVAATGPSPVAYGVFCAERVLNTRLHRAPTIDRDVLAPTGLYASSFEERL